MPKVCLNAGHKVGMDPGVVGSKGNEAELVLKYANIAADYLRQVGYDVLVVQENELYDICAASDNYGADVFVSIHINGAVNTGAYGTEVFYYAGSANSEKLANCVYSQVESYMVGSRLAQRPDVSETLVRDISNRGIKDGGPDGANLYVVKHTAAPACLLEVGFISNDLDQDILIYNYDQIGAAIARGVSDYFA